MYTKKHTTKRGFPIFVIGDGKVTTAYITGMSNKEGITVIGNGKNKQFFDSLKVAYVLAKDVKKLSGSIVVAVRPDNAVSALDLIKRTAKNPDLISSIVSGLTIEDVATLGGQSSDYIAIVTLNTNIAYRAGIIWYYMKNNNESKNVILSKTFAGLGPGPYGRGMTRKIMEEGDSNFSEQSRMLEGVTLVGSRCGLDSKAIYLTYDYLIHTGYPDLSVKSFLQKLKCGRYPKVISEYLKTMNVSIEKMVGHKGYNRYSGKIFHSTVNALLRSGCNSLNQIKKHIDTVVTPNGSTAEKIGDMNCINVLRSEAVMSNVLAGINQKAAKFRQIALSKTI